MSKISNVITMLELLSSGRKYNIKELSEQLEVKGRMIRLYKDELAKAGIYIDTVKGPYGGYVLNQNINVPKRFIIPNNIEIMDKDIFNIINRSIKEKRKLKIIYYSNENGNSERIIKPYDLFLYGNEWGIAAYCELRNDIRHFYINRIKKVEILEIFNN